VPFLDQYAAPSRSAALHEAVNPLRQKALMNEYAAARDEWDGSEDAQLRKNTTADER
jgi:hypothetical protein